MTIPHTRPAVWPEISPGRFASTIRQDSPAGCAIALLGIPDDTGVRLNNGRAGAAEGPAAFRAALARYGASEPANGAFPRVFDAGDIVPGATLDETHARVTAATSAIVGLNLLPIAIGGGHDLTYPFVRAVAKSSPLSSGIYFDAHLDVRDTPGSGMSFRRLIEDGLVRSLHLHGFRPLVNSRAHRDWFSDHGGKVHADRSPVQAPSAGDLFASFDFDVLDAAYAPGVSAQNPSGWTPHEAEQWVHALGAEKRVRCFDLMELNPPWDEGGRTARLAAHLFLTFLAGFASRT